MTKEEARGLIASGDYICLYNYYEKGWKIIEIPEFKGEERCYKLIHKKHKDILDAYLADNSVEIEWLNGMKEGYQIWSTFSNFINNYDCKLNYRLATRHGERETAKVLSEIGETLTIKDGDKVYEFEKPDFECELLKVVSGDTVATDIIVGIIKLNNKWIPYIWWNDGISKINDSMYCLTPIKPKWFEVESNFPALIWNEDNNLEVVRGLNDFECLNWNLCKLATNEEIDQLKVNTPHD